MARWPRTIQGNVIAFGLAIFAGAILVQLAMALSGPVVWSLIAISVVVPLGLYLRHAKVQRAHDIAVAGAPSFADVLGRRGKDRVDPAAIPVAVRATHAATEPRL